MNDVVIRAESATRRIVEAPEGGRVILQATAVHLHECRAWRMGRRFKPCSCGASREWQRWAEQLAAAIADVPDELPRHPDDDRMRDEVRDDSLYRGQQ